MKKNEAKQLLVFSYGLPLICCLLAWRQYVKHGLTVWVESFIVIGVIVLFMALFAKSQMKVLFTIWMQVARVIGTVMTSIIFTIFFFFIITPVSIFLRLMGKDFMDLMFKSQEGSYWIKRENKNQDYTQQF